MFIILYDVAYFSKNKTQLLTVSRLTIWILFIIILEVFGVFLVIVLEISIYRRYSGKIYSENMYFGLPIDLKSFLKSRLDFMCLFVYSRSKFKFCLSFFSSHFRKYTIRCTVRWTTWFTSPQWEGVRGTVFPKMTFKTARLSFMDHVVVWRETVAVTMTFATKGQGLIQCLRHHIYHVCFF